MLRLKVTCYFLKSHRQSKVIDTVVSDAADDWLVMSLYLTPEPRKAFQMGRIIDCEL